MANLDKLLRKIEKNYEAGEETQKHELTIGGETYEVRTMTRKEKSEFMYNLEAGKKDYKAGDLIKIMIKPIYKCFDLSTLATKAKDAGYIKNFYDVVEMLFEPTEILEIIAFIFQINGLDTEQSALEEIEEIKK